MPHAVLLPAPIPAQYSVVSVTVNAPVPAVCPYMVILLSAPFKPIPPCTVKLASSAKIRCTSPVTVTRLLISTVPVTTYQASVAFSADQAVISAVTSVAEVRVCSVPLASTYVMLSVADTLTGIHPNTKTIHNMMLSI